MSPAGGVAASTSDHVCASCHAMVLPHHAALSCTGCGTEYPTVAGLPDLRLASDRYLSLVAERVKAERLAALAPTTDVLGLASAYYEITDDVLDHRRERFLRHIAGALARGQALAGELEGIPGRVLELGCGTGGFLVAAAQRGVRIEGVDIASRWLVVARRRLDDHGLDVPLTVAQAEHLPWPNAHFSAVVADSLLEHCDDPRAVLAECLRVLRPGGWLRIWSPNRYMLTTDPHVNLWGVGWLPRRGAERYLRLRGRTDWLPRTLSTFGIARLARAAGFVAVEAGPAAIPPEWSAQQPRATRRAMFAYEQVRQNPVGRTLLAAIGPLWALRARKPG